MGSVLLKHGFWLESAAIAEPGVLSQGEELLLSGQVLTAASANYPERWLHLLGEAAPPALWISGRIPVRPLVTVVGCRNITSHVKHFAHDVGELAFHRGFAVVSGGAVGCDTAATGGALHAAKAVAGAGVALEILPYGLSHAAIGESCQLSLSPPGEPFTTPAAMERNTLVYAISERSLVVQAQLKQGGSWIGATSALRRHLSSVFIRDDNSSASRALASLGATPIQSPEQLFSLRPSVAQPSIPMLEGTGAA